MGPSHFNFPVYSPTLENEFVPHTQSISQDFFIPPLQTSAAGYHFPLSQQSYSSHDQATRGTTPVPLVAGERSFSSAGNGSVSPSISSDSSDQVRLRHDADHVPASRQPPNRHPLPTFVAPALAPDTMVPHNPAIGHCGSHHRHYLSQIPIVPRRVVLAPAPTASEPRFSTTVSHPNENMSSYISAPLPPPPALPSSYHAPPLSSPLPHTSADPADIEYAHQRYGNKRCFYQCQFDLHGSPCNKWIVGDRTRVLRHLRHHHHLQTGPVTAAVCRWAACTHTRPMKQENLSRHIVGHLGVKWRCPHCRRSFSRDDAVHRHIERMVPGMDVTDAEVIPGEEARAIIEPQYKRPRLA